MSASKIQMGEIQFQICNIYFLLYLALPGLTSVNYALYNWLESSHGPHQTPYRISIVIYTLV